MGGFSEVHDSGEQIENIVPERKIEETIPEDVVSLDEADTYWDHIFTEPDNTAVEVDIEALERDVYGVSEEDFEFDIDIENEELQSAISHFDESEWSDLSETERECCIEEFASVLGEQLDLKYIPEICYQKMDKEDYGYYSPMEKNINVNSMLLDNPRELVKTVAHEMRHAYQHERAEKLDTYTDQLYCYNIDNYISADEDYNEYRDQYIEAEARAFEKLFA